MKQKHSRCKVRGDSKRSRSLKERLHRADLSTLRYLCFLL
jgi:hypothetical protein